MGSVRLVDRPPGEAKRTWTERSFAGEASRKSLVLIHIGSPELGFANAGRVYPLEGLVEVRFGRSSDVQTWESTSMEGLLEVGIPLGWASREHAALRVTEADRGGFLLQLADLGSKNGTTVEDQRIHRPTRLQAGSVFEVGRSFWMVREVEGEPATAATELDGTGTVSPELGSTYRKLQRLAASDVPIVVIGETGVGKDRVARVIHELGGRTGKFVRFDLAASPVEHLVGTMAAGAGPLAEARSGTLFIDEVGEASDAAQSQLTSLFGAAGETADVRIIAATTRDLAAMVGQGSFRPDLYARLVAYEARLLPLRDRREDLGLLVRNLVRGPGGEAPKMSTRAFRQILRHRWPFNVRELCQALQAAKVLGEGEVTDESLHSVIGRNRGDMELGPSRIQLIREELVRQLVENSGDTVAVAQALQCPEERVTAWLDKFELDPSRYRTWIQ